MLADSHCHLNYKGLAEEQGAILIHPHEADAHPHIDTAKLIERARHPRVFGIGESGLDYYYDHSDRERQQASFRAHIAACRETGLPLVVHTRDAEADTAAILAEEMGKGAYPGVIHCFTESIAQCVQHVRRERVRLFRPVDDDR